MLAFATVVVHGRNGLMRSPMISNPTSNKGSKKLLQHIQRAFYATRPTGFRAAAPVKRRTLMEALKAPASDTPFIWGRAIALGGGVTGLGYLCYYGLGLSNELTTLEKSVLWPPYVKERIHATYAYLAGSVAITAVSAVAVSRNPMMMNLMMRQGWMALIGTFAAMIGTGMVARSIEYRPGGVGAKQLAWIVHTAVMGAVIAPLTLLGGPIMARAALYTGGLIAGLSTTALVAPTDRFVNGAGWLSMGLGVVVAASVGTWFLPPTTMLGAGIYSIALYGGLVVFGAFMLYDTKRVIRAAETHPVFGVKPFDPINAQMGIYMDAMNIFIRIAMILSGGGSRRK